MGTPGLLRSKVTPGWSAATLPLADRGPAERFGAVASLDDFEKGMAGWTASAGGQNAKASLALDEAVRHAGAASLRVEYEFAGKEDLEYVEFGRPIAVEKPGLGLGLWVRGGEPRATLRLRIRDKTGETHQVDLGRLGSDDWQYVAVAFETDGGWWGGDGNHRLDYPCTLYGILADRPKRGFRGKGRLWIDGLELVRPRKPEAALKVEVLDKRLGNVYEPGETVVLRASGPGEAIRWRVVDFWEREVASGEGPAAAAAVRFGLPEAGFFACTLERLAAGKVAEARVFRCAALPPADPRRRNAFVGVCSHFGQRAYPLETMDLMARYGITEIRDEISWGGVEREKGKLAVPDFAHAYVEHAHQLGVKPLIIFDYANRFYDDGGYPLSDEAVAGYVSYSVELATALRGKVGYFEVWNEYSGGCGMSGKTGKQTPQTYARMLEATYRAVKQAVPEATIVGIGGEHSEHHLTNIGAMMEAGAARHMDAFSVHPYRYPGSPEETDLVGEIRTVARLAKRHGAPTRIWATEVGWPTHIGPRGVDERTQAHLIVRTLALLQATGVVEKVHWYDFKDDGLNRDYNEHNFGVVRHQTLNYAPKPAAVTLSVFARMTAGAEAVRLSQSDGIYMILYRLPRGRELAVAWTAGGKTVLRVTGRGIEAFDIMGNPLADPRLVVLSDAPVYVTGKGLWVPKKRASR